MKYKVIDENVIYMECNSETTYIHDKEAHEDDYSLSNCVLVRTTHAFPFGHEIHTPLFDGFCEPGLPGYLHYPIIDALKKQYPETWSKEKEKYYIQYESQRDTIHFTINGLVQSSIYGNFEARPFIIIEPLKYHIDDTLISLRPEDTFFKGNVELSEDCVLIIRERMYNEIKNNPKYEEELKKYRVFVYSGENEIEALNNVLEMINCDMYMMSNHGYTDGEKAGTNAHKMTTFIRTFAETNQIPQRRHCYTVEYSEENNRNEQKTEEINRKYIEYILENSNASEELKKKILDIIPNYNYYSDNELFERLVEEIGLDVLRKLTEQFNQIMFEERRIDNKQRR